MSHYLVDQIRRQSNIAVQLRSEIYVFHGNSHFSAIDIRDSASSAIHRHECGGVLIFIGADAETDWLPPELPGTPAVMSGDDLKKSGR
jgi:thioredoxin reductase (NADPH)